MQAFLYILALFLVGNLFAQDARLFQQEWYLHDLVIDGENNVPPVNSELHHVPLNFNKPDEFRTYVCSGTEGLATLTFNTANEFRLLNLNWLAGSCNIYENELYTYLYQGFWNDTLLDPYHYKITEDGSNLILIVIASNENIAIYRTDFLSTQEFEKSVYKIFPNPVDDHLFLKLSNDVVAQSIILFDVQGRLVHQESPTQTGLIEIDSSSFHAGLYFVEVIDDKGRSSIERFLKN